MEFLNKKLYYFCPSVVLYCSSFFYYQYLVSVQKLHFFKQQEKYQCWQYPPPPLPGKAIGLMVTKVPIFVVHIMEVRMRIRYAVSKKHFLDFDSTLRTQKFNQEEAKKSIWVPSTIPNQPPVEMKNCPYSDLVTRTCGTDLWYIHACAVGLLYKNKCCLNHDYKISRRCDQKLCKKEFWFFLCSVKGRFLQWQ